MIATNISIIIPSVGNLPLLRRCFASLASEARSHSFEVVVVLDGIAGPPRLAEVAIEAGLAVRWIEQSPKRGPGAARNRGVAEAGGETCIFLDEDMEVEPGFIAAYAAVLDGRAEVAVLGAIHTECKGYGGVYRSTIERFWGERHYRLTHEEQPRFDDCFSGNLGLPRELFAKTGGFDESLPRNEDLDFGLRLQRAGATLIYGSRARASQEFRKSPAQSMRDCETTGAAAIRLWQEYPEARRRMHFAVASHGRRNARWLRRRALSSRWHLERLAPLLPWLPTMPPTELLAWFLQDLAGARGAREELADQAKWIGLSEGTLFLCYHRFSTSRKSDSEFTIPVEQFRRQMLALRKADYRFATASEWAEAWHRGEPLPHRTAVITIDDGTSDIAAVAWPVLRELGIPATLYVVADWIGKDGYLKHRELQELAANGWEIGSHSLSHPWLTKLPEETQRREIIESRNTLGTLSTFAYPYGDNDAATIAMAEHAGYTAALGVERGYAYPHTSAWNVPRFVVDGRWPLWLFRLIVISGATGPGLP